MVQPIARLYIFISQTIYVEKTYLPLFFWQIEAGWFSIISFHQIIWQKINLNFPKDDWSTDDAHAFNPNFQKSQNN